VPVGTLPYAVQERNPVPATAGLAQVWKRRWPWRSCLPPLQVTKRHRWWVCAPRLVLLECWPLTGRERNGSGVPPEK